MNTDSRRSDSGEAAPTVVENGAAIGGQGTGKRALLVVKINQGQRLHLIVPSPLDCIFFLSNLSFGSGVMAQVFQVDAFASTAFTGNPAAVCLLQTPASTDWMQAFAAEMNLSETAFVHRLDDGRFGLRWFTPAVEVDLCGHATLATAHVLWETGEVARDTACLFETASGPLMATRRGERIELDFPRDDPSETEAPAGMIEALGAAPRFVGLARHDWLAVLDSSDQVRQLAPDMTGLRSLGVRGVIATAADATGEYDFISRFFAPGAGIDEDPVTGSAHCVLGPWWSEELGKSKMRAFQTSRRGGELEVEITADRVLLRGKAVTVLKGELSIGTG